MQHAVVLEVLRERERYSLRHSAQHHGGPRQAKRRLPLDSVDEFRSALPNLKADRIQDFLALAPGEHEKRNRDGDQQGKPAAVEELG